MSPDAAVRRIAIAVRSLEKARRLFETLLGGTFAPPAGGTDGTVRSLVWRRGPAEPAVELIQPLDEDGAVARFIRKRGEGIHHLTVAVKDLEGTLRLVAEAGGRIVRTPSYYRRGGGGPVKEAFVHPKDAHGVLFHLVEEE